MKTFIEYVESKKVEKLIIECAELMAEMNIDPIKYLLDYVSKDPEAEKCLLEHINFQEGLWDSVKDFAGRAAGAAKAIGGSLWSGGGLKYGLQHAKDAFSGPAAKFDFAVKALDDLVKSLEKGYVDENGNRVAYNNPPVGKAAQAFGKTSVIDWIKALKAELKNQETQIPKLQAAQVSATMGTKQPKKPAPQPKPEAPPTNPAASPAPEAPPTNPAAGS